MAVTTATTDATTGDMTGGTTGGTMTGGTTGGTTTGGMTGGTIVNGITISTASTTAQIGDQVTRTERRCHRRSLAVQSARRGRHHLVSMRAERRCQHRSFPMKAHRGRHHLVSIRRLATGIALGVATGIGRDATCATSVARRERQHSACPAAPRSTERSSRL